MDYLDDFVREIQSDELSEEFEFEPGRYWDEMEANP